MLPRLADFGEEFFLVTLWSGRTAFIQETSSDDETVTSATELAKAICDCHFEFPISAIFRVIPRAETITDHTSDIAKLVEAELHRRYETVTTADYLPEIAIDLVNRFRRTDVLVEFRAYEEQEARDAARQARERSLVAS